jgi:membrane complex biogenesis BtpA family protein
MRITRAAVSGYDAKRSTIGTLGAGVSAGRILALDFIARTLELCRITAGHQTMKTTSIFELHPKLFIGVVHLKPLPGSPRWHGDFENVINNAIIDAQAYDRGGAHALFIENFNDAPFAKGCVGPETVAAMCAVARAIREHTKLPIGFNVLRNDVRAALALCAATGGSFVRVNVHCGAMLTDQGIIEGDAYNTIRYRHHICPHVKILADVHVKHAVPLGDSPIGDDARELIERGMADAVIVSGIGTGYATDFADVEMVRRAVPHGRMLIGSGVNPHNVTEYLRQADGIIVGSSLKFNGRLSAHVDQKRVAALAKLVK